MKDSFVVLTLLLLLQSYCCISNEVAKRVVGGYVPEAADRYPWMVSLIDSKGSLICGGTLISSRWILTSARCLMDTDALTLRTLPYIVLGAFNFSSPPPKQTIVLSEAIFIHPYFHPSQLSNDIALVRIPSSSSFTPIRIASLNNSADSKLYQTNSPAFVLGWGRTTESVVAASKILQQADLFITSQTTCQNTISPYRSIFRQVCAAAAASTGGGGRFCYGDIGGPLFSTSQTENSDSQTTNTKNHTFDTLIGIASWFLSCNKLNTPSVFTDVRYYNDWINNIIQSNNNGDSFCHCPCSVCPSLIEPTTKIACQLSVQESTCQFARCYGSCLLGTLGDGNCDDRCDSVACDFDKHDCEHNETDLEDSSFEELPTSSPWEIYDEGQSTPLVDISRCNSTALPYDLRKHCFPADGKRFVFMSGIKMLLSTDSYICQRADFPTSAPIQLGMYIHMFCSSSASSDWLEIRIDSELIFKFNSNDCNWFTSSEGYSWISANVSKFADGAEHEIVISAHVAPVSPPTAFFIDVLRFIDTKQDPNFETVTGPCDDKTFPIIMPKEKEPIVCPWLETTCCSSLDQETTKKVIDLNNAITNSTCYMDLSCQQIIIALNCPYCSWHNSSIFDINTGKVKICKEYAEAMHYLCSQSEVFIDRKCIPISEHFTTTSDLANYFGIYTTSKDCYNVDPADVITGSGIPISEEINQLSGGAIAAIVICAVIFVGAVTISAVVIGRVLYFKHREPDDVEFAEKEFRAGRRGFLSASPHVTNTNANAENEKEEEGAEKKKKTQQIQRTEDGTPIESLHHNDV